MVSWKSYGIVERDVSNKDFSRSIITGSENRGGRKRKVLLCCIYTPISCSISIAGTDHRFFFFFFFLPSETRWSMARQFVCKSDGRSTIKNSELRKFDPVRAFLKVPGELLSFFSLVVSDPTTVILVLFFFFFFCFRTWQNFLCFNLILLIGREKRRTSEKNEYRCAVMLTRLECRWTSNNQSKREDRK